MRIMGLDPGSLRTGYGIIVGESGRLRCATCGVLRPARGAPLSERLWTLHRGLTALLQEEPLDAIALEEAFIGRHPRPALVLGHARGALIVAALARGIPVYEYAPRRIKQSVTGVGGASKQQVQQMIGHLVTGLPVTISLDEADAIAVAVCHAHRSPLRSQLEARS
ncbi:MAG: crossover junction endodeoxyribonuclease RuvC [Candidatus Eisenbacteria bacterium]|nr:crossover junction endodeoxyribonuclease RuvC [Candidatus Eisenbacteria bacterium]